MADLVVIVPSRGRPESARALVQAFTETCVADTELSFAIDDNDPTRDDYTEVVRETDFRASVGIDDQPQSMGHALHAAATAFASSFQPTPFAIGFMGDDHRPRTHGWDKAYVDALRELGTGIVYGNDLLQGERLPTQVAMTTDIVRALGYMAPPGLIHLYFDNFWRDLGAVAGCLRYLPDVVVEHCHPIAGKAEWDEGYRRVNASSMYEHDAAVYQEYQRTRFDADVAKVKALRGA